jgi:hypothetical protein
MENKYLKYKYKYLQAKLSISNQIKGGSSSAIIPLEECPVCLENKHLYSIFQCTHLVCISCIVIHLLGVYTDRNIRTCPLCRSQTDNNKLEQMSSIIQMRINNIESSNLKYNTLFSLPKQLGNYLNRPNLIRVRTRVITTVGIGIGISMVANINTIVGGLFRLLRSLENQTAITPVLDQLVWVPILAGITYYPVFDGIILPRINHELQHDTDINIFKKTIRNLSICLVIDAIPVIIRWTIGITCEQQTEIINGLLYRIGSQFMRGGAKDDDSFENYNIIINDTNYEQFRINIIKLYNNLDEYNSHGLEDCTTYLEIYDKQKINSSI